MFTWGVAVALAADPPDVVVTHPSEPPPAPSPSELALQLLGVVLDDTQPDDVRQQALADVGALGDPRVLPFLEAAADRAEPALAGAIAASALQLATPESPEVVRRVLRSGGLPRPEADTLVLELGQVPSPEAGEALWALVGDRAVPVRLRRLSEDTLLATHPDVVARLGAPPTVPDLLGSALFLTAGATAGGVVLGSIGELGQWNGGITAGAVGGGVVGAAVTGLRLADRSATKAQGLALASGVGWGVAAGVWLPYALYGSVNYYPYPESETIRARGAGLRAASTLGGTALGYLGSGRDPSVGDVLEVNVAGYLGSATVGGLVLLAFPTPQATATTFPTATRIDAFEEQRRASQRYAGGELLGAVTGLGAGAVLAPKWDLGWNDAAFGVVVGAEAAWLGATVPDLVGVDDDALEGLFWFPSHGGTLVGLAVAELLPSSPGRTLATGFGATVGNAFGASLPLLQGYDDERSVSAGSVPGGLVGMGLGYALQPVLRPSTGDAAMIGVSTAVVGSAGFFVGEGLAEAGAWTDPAQGTGLGLFATGVAGVGTWALVPFVEARVDEALFVGSAATLGALYGGLGTLALGGDADTSLFAAAGGEAGATALSAVLVSRPVDLEPRSALVPEVGAVAGATVGALGAALFSGDSQDIAGGTVIGATAGLGLGLLVEVAAHPLGRGGARGVVVRAPAGPQVSPVVQRSDSGTPLLGVSVQRW